MLTNLKLLIGAGACFWLYNFYAFADPEWFMTNSSHEIAGFIAAQTENDYTQFRIDGSTNGSWATLVEFAASRNYVDVLSALENYEAISEYTVSDGLGSPLALAVANSATQAVVYLADLRSDWLDMPIDGVGSIMLIDLALPHFSMLEVLLSSGAYLNTTNSSGYTVMDKASSYGLATFELLRSNGGLFSGNGRERRVRTGFKSLLASNYLAFASTAYVDRISFPSGTTIFYNIEVDPLSGESIMAELPPESQQSLEGEILNTASLCHGTILIHYHQDAGRGISRYIEPILWNNKIFGLYKADPDVVQNMQWEVLYPTTENHYFGSATDSD